ncbi:toll/interleukin-1 receptor (TIR) domain-containing protein [Artemisia annua]|uniref:Toll/interleukin-1 receptor (TIR) domain-containing protein n=1 Tax=Artemisia annua TaxID=35608 RepID=A0A2U1PPZ4_ARTAN|nr:toll/interleukin-1 receptor (TIR) domain-containing protein [Artemisia annua]
MSFSKILCLEIVLTLMLIVSTPTSFGIKLMLMLMLLVSTSTSVPIMIILMLVLILMLMLFIHDFLLPFKKNFIRYFYSMASSFNSSAPKREKSSSNSLYQKKEESSSNSSAPTKEELSSNSAVPEKEESSSNSSAPKIMVSTSASSIQNSFKYDVFLSFRGEDTRKNFVDHLYQALKEKGIYTYKDNEKIQKGKRISDDLFKSIEDSKFYIIVFSKNYASSSWCLEELVKIMECHKMTGHTAYPLFYDGLKPKLRIKIKLRSYRVQMQRQWAQFCYPPRRESSLLKSPHVHKDLDIPANVNRCKG